MLNTTFSRIMNISPVQRQSMISILWSLIFTVIGFLSTMYFAHALGAGVLGAYFLFITYLGILNIFSDGGLNSATIKRISEGEDQSAFFTAYFAVRISLFLFLILGLKIFGNLFVDIDGSVMIFWLPLALFVYIFSDAITVGNGGLGKIGVTSTSTFIGNVSRVIVQIIAVILGYRTGGLIGGFIMGVLVSGIFGWRFFEVSFARFNRKHLKSLFSFSFWMFLSSSGGLVFAYADTALIGHFLKNSDVGVYNVAFQFTGLVVLVSNALIAVLWPKISYGSKIGDIDLLEKSLTKSIIYSLILAVPLLVGGWVLGDKMLLYFYGKEFSSGTYALILLFPVRLVTIIASLLGTYIFAMDHPKEGFRIILLSAVTNIMLDWFFIPILGITGAALATLISMTLLVIIERHVLSQYMSVKMGVNNMNNILKASLVMGLFIVGYRFLMPLDNLLFMIPVIFGALIYFVLLLKMDKAIHDELQDIIQSAGLIWPKWL